MLPYNILLQTTTYLIVDSGTTRASDQDGQKRVIMHFGYLPARRPVNYLRCRSLCGWMDPKISDPIVIDEAHRTDWRLVAVSARWSYRVRVDTNLNIFFIFSIITVLSRFPAAGKRDHNFWKIIRKRYLTNDRAQVAWWEKALEMG